MRVTLTAQDLLDFEERVAEAFLAKKIRAPVHLSGGNERELIELFAEYVNEDDWVLSTWRSHYHCLLKGVPADELFAAILKGRSISLCFPNYRVLSSAIVGGTAPVAVGLGMAIRRKRAARKVVCFIGDMAAETGIFHEAVKYASRHGLPVLWVVEDNGLSVTTATASAWGGVGEQLANVARYHYRLTRPHVGVGQFVKF